MLPGHRTTARQYRIHNDPDRASLCTTASSIALAYHAREGSPLSPPSIRRARLHLLPSQHVSSPSTIAGTQGDEMCTTKLAYLGNRKAHVMKITPEALLLKQAATAATSRLARLEVIAGIPNRCLDYQQVQCDTPFISSALAWFQDHRGQETSSAWQTMCPWGTILTGLLVCLIVLRFFQYSQSETV